MERLPRYSIIQLRTSSHFTPLTALDYTLVWGKEATLTPWTTQVLEPPWRVCMRVFC